MKIPRWPALSALAAAAVLAASIAAGSTPPAPAPPAAKAKAPAPDGAASPLDIQAEPPPFTEGIFPCSQCHDKAVDPSPHALAFHDEIQANFHHGPPSRWCLDCHDNAKRDFVHLINGTLVPFTRSYELCGQCHGDKYRDWKVGVHGKRTGMWNGAKTYYLCVNCHNPHNPRFQALKPEPPPVRPQEQGR